MDDLGLAVLETSEAAGVGLGIFGYIRRTSIGCRCIILGCIGLIS